MDPRPPGPPSRPPRPGGTGTSVLCPRCGRRFAPLCAPDERTAPCPHCGNVLWVEAAAAGAETSRCQTCGEMIPREAHLCRHCNEPQNVAHDEPLTTSIFGWLRPKRPQDRLALIPVKNIVANPYQPREEVDIGSAEFEDLKQSIEAYGVLVPIIVAPRRRKHVLVAGQRRLACCRLLRFKTIPAIVRALTPLQIIEVSYLENLHRKSLSRVELATGFQRLMMEMPHLSSRALCRKLGRSLNDVEQDGAIASLPVVLREAIKRGLLGEEHALKIRHIRNEQILVELIKRIYLCRLSPQETEQLARRCAPPGAAASAGS